MKNPSQYLPVMPYLILNNASDFLDFVKIVFDAEEQMVVPGDDAGSIMHAEIKIGDAVIMFAEATEMFTEKSAGMFLFVEDVDKVYDLALHNNAVSLQLPQQKEYGYSAGFEDPFGNQWWITTP